jgi:hypothetical protein
MALEQDAGRLIRLCGGGLLAPGAEFLALLAMKPRCDAEPQVNEAERAARIF